MLCFGLKVESLFCGLHRGPFNKFRSRENSVVATCLCLASEENFISKLNEFVSYYIFISIKSSESVCVWWGERGKHANYLTGL